MVDPAASAYLSLLGGWLRERSRQEGLEQGRVQTMRRAIDELLRARGVTSELTRARLERSDDPDRLERWFSDLVSREPGTAITDIFNS